MQARLFLAAAKEYEPEHYPYYCALTWAGLRPAEGMAVRAEKIDMRGRSILVDAQIGQHGGLKSTKTGDDRQGGPLGSPRFHPGRRGGTADADDAKGGRHHRRVTGRGRQPAARPVALLSRPRADAEREGRAACLQAGAGRDAPHAGEGRPTGLLRPALAEAHLRLGLISQGVSPAYVQQQMGHASIEQTVDTYGSWFPVRVPGAVDALAEATAPGSLGHQMDTFEVSEPAEVR